MTQQKSKIEKFRFILMDEDDDLESEEQIRALFAQTKKKYEYATIGVSYAALQIAEEIYGDGHNTSFDWPIYLLGMDSAGRIYQLEISIEMIPDFESESKKELYPANVDDKTIPMPFMEQNPA